MTKQNLSEFLKTKNIGHYRRKAIIEANFPEEQKHEAKIEVFYPTIFTEDGKVKSSIIIWYEKNYRDPNQKYFKNIMAWLIANRFEGVESQKEVYETLQELQKDIDSMP